MRRLGDNIKMPIKPVARVCTTCIWPGIKYSSILFIVFVPSIHNIYKDQMYSLNYFANHCTYINL